MKSRICASLLIACLPWLAMAQSNDDLYFIPKKEKKTVDAFMTENNMTFSSF